MAELLFRAEMELASMKASLRSSLPRSRRPSASPPSPQIGFPAAAAYKRGTLQPLAFL